MFGRGPQFDPRTDSSVRVNVARLRSKLIEYYATEGKDDPLRIEIPKGSYITVFHRHEEAPRPAGAAAGGDAHPAGSARRPSGLRQLTAFSATLAAGFALGAALTAWLGGGTRASSGGMADPGLQRFWDPFVEAPEQTIVVFSSARFVGDVSGAALLQPFRRPPRGYPHPAYRRGRSSRRI